MPFNIYQYLNLITKVIYKMISNIGKLQSKDMQNLHSPSQKNYSQKYEPLRWPPSITLAQTHLKCICPGKDSIVGAECPCCKRLQKVEVTNWYSRDIFKDFKSYGGGIPCYFSLIKYCVVSLAILAIIVTIYHIIILEYTCPKIYETLKACRNYSQQQLEDLQCQEFLFIFKICDSRIIQQTLICRGEGLKSDIYFYLQLFSFIYLITVTVGMKIWVQRANSNKIIREDKIFSLFALIIKNIPKYYSVDDLKKQIIQIVPGAQICQIFFLYQIAQLQNQFKKLLDLHFVIEYERQQAIQKQNPRVFELQKMIAKYRKLYQKVDKLKNNMNFNNGRAIVVFNNIEHRNQLHNVLKINECTKFGFNSMKLLGLNTKRLHIFSDTLSEPREIIWKYIGQNDVTKNWVRVKTTAYGFGFMAMCFLLLYFPIIWIFQEDTVSHSIQTTLLGVLISIILKIFSAFYRLIILRLLPSRQPSSRQTQSYFVVISTITFHFFFYIVAPGTYFAISTKIPINIKLKQLFINIFFFLGSTVFLAVLDVRYRLYQRKKNNLLGSESNWGKFCQIRLHQQIKWPTFPIQFKLMALLDIWAFTAFNIFQAPYLLFLLALSLILIYWNDKRILYKHYKMQVYQSIDVEISVQRDYIYMFLVCVSFGYAVSATYTWQYIMIACVFVLAIVVNSIISYQKRSLDVTCGKNASLFDFIKIKQFNPRQTFFKSVFEKQLKENLMMIESNSTVSLGSTSFQYGYKELYDSYLGQFRNKNILRLLQQTNNYISDPQYCIKTEIKQIREQIRYLTNLIQQSQKMPSQNKPQTAKPNKQQFSINNPNDNSSNVDEVQSAKQQSVQEDGRQPTSNKNTQRSLITDSNRRKDSIESK